MKELELVQLACADCGVAGEREVPMALKHVTRFYLCENCSSTREQKVREEAIEEELAKKKQRWEMVCPPRYEDTDLRKLPGHYQWAVNQWVPQDGEFLGFVGAVRVGKTRSAYMALKRLFYSGFSVDATPSVEYAQIFSDIYGMDAKRREGFAARIERCRSVDVLFLDDIGKERFTERAVVELYRLIEWRIAHKLSIIWTSNYTGNELKEIIKGVDASAIVERLKEFSFIPTVQNPSPKQPK